MDKKPNIVLILIDDMGWKDTSICGSTFYESPAIDRLMQDGIMFENAYSTSPVCSPARASVLTGRYPASLGVTDWIDTWGQCHPLKGRLMDAPYIKHLPPGEYNIARALKDNGYNTYHVGKWHLGTKEYYPERQGFDINIAGCHLGHPPKGYFSPYHIGNLKDGPDGEYLTDRLTDEAIGLIRENGEKPFFLNLWHYSVHTPIEAPADDIRYFEEKARKLRLDSIDPFETGEFFPTLDKKDRHVVRRRIQSDCAYAAMIRNLDMNIKRILDAVENAGKLEETVFIFTSDNGGLSTSEGSPTCNAPASEGKGWMYEGGLRVPLSITWYGRIKPGMKADTPVTVADIYPTIMELTGAGLRSGQRIDGTSLVPLLEGGDIPERPLFWHYPHYGNQGGTPGSSVRTGRWKLIEFFEDMHAELYDLENDIAEKHDLCGVFPEKCDELRKMLHKWQETAGAKIPERNPGWEDRQKT